MSTSPLFLSNDARMVDRIRKGDEEALAELYRINRRPIVALVTGNSGTADDAEDILQEALLVLWERVRTGRFEYTAKLGTFVYATAHNIWLRRLARLRREVRGNDWTDDPPTGDASPLELLVEEEDAGIVSRSLERLGEPCKTLLLLFYWEELSMGEIASRMGFANADTVKSKKYQCKKALEQLLRGMQVRYD